nr:MAG TPA: hypothetical protein [Caudoviricetes sp.]
MPNSMRVRDLGSHRAHYPAGQSALESFDSTTRNHNSKFFNSTLKRNFENLENSD